MILRRYLPPDIKDKKVLLRLDLDVAADDAGQDLRLERAAASVVELLSLGAKQIIMCGHRGRPDGKLDQAFSLVPVKDKLELLLNKAGVQQKINLVAMDTAGGKPAGVLMMLENLRFYPGEKAGDDNFARTLAAWGEVYINDAFGNSHRGDASMLAVAKILPAFAGPGLIHEIEELTRFMENTPRPYVAILGGAKIETKIPLIRQLLGKADTILMAGALANTIFKSRGQEVGQSLVEDGFAEEAKKIDGAKIILPLDVIVADGSVKAINNLAAPDFIGDIGPATVELFKDKIAGAKAILWNGPMGKFEDAKFQAGTDGILDAIINSGAIKIAGGGDTLDILKAKQALDKFNFVSVGGGAMLAFLAGEAMPALEALK